MNALNEVTMMVIGTATGITPVPAEEIQYHAYGRETLNLNPVFSRVCLPERMLWSVMENWYYYKGLVGHWTCDPREGK